MKLRYVLPLLLLMLCVASPALALFKAGDPAPDFSAQTLDDQSLKLSDLKGKTLLIAFGTTWCPSCNVQAHMLDGMRDRLRELDITYVSVFLGDGADSITEHIKTEGIKDPDQLLIDRGEARRAYNIFSIPRLIMLAPDGNIIFDEMTLEEKELKRRLETYEGLAK